MQVVATITDIKGKWKNIARILSLLASGLLILYGVLSFDLVDTKVNLIVLNLYYFLFALLILLSEFNFKKTISLFGFMGNLAGKGIFIVFVGLSLFGGDATLRTIIAIIILLIGLVLVGMWFVPNRILTKESESKSSSNANKKYGETAGQNK